MNNIIFYLFFLLGSIYSTVINGQKIDTIKLETKIDALVPKHVNDSTPGLVVGIVLNGELIFSKAYGLANLSYGIPIDTKTIYNIGSVSKQFLGYAYAMLHVEGTLNLDDPVNNYLENWPVFEHPVTLRHLLSHTSGYREAYTLSYLAGRPLNVDRLSREECLNVVRKQSQLEFVPGSRFSYNSTAWVILTEIFEKVKSQTAEEWMEMNIFDPLSMEETQIKTYVGEVIENAVEPYSSNDLGYVNSRSNRAIFGAGDIYSSIQDLVNWINNFRTAKVGGQEVRDLFLAPFEFNNGSNSEYALGIVNNSYRGLRRFFHNGGGAGLVNGLCYFPDQDLGIITMTNFGGKTWISTEKIAELLLEEYLAPSGDVGAKGLKISAKKLGRYTGRYLITRLNRDFDFKVIDDSLTIDGREKLIPTGEDTFRNHLGNVQYKFELPTDSVARLTITNPIESNEYYRVDPWSPSREELRVFEGDFWSDEIETVYHLTVKDEKLSIQHRWIGEFTLEAVKKDIFKAGQSFYFIFNRDSNGDVKSFSVNSPRTLNVRFQRKAE